MTKIVDATTGEVLGTLVSDGNGSVEYHVQTELYDIEDVCDEEDVFDSIDAWISNFEFVG